MPSDPVPSPVSPRRPRRRLGWALLVLLAILCVAAAVDMPVFHWCRAHLKPRGIDRLDVTHMLRSGGYYPTWLLASTALLLVDRSRRREGLPGGYARGLSLMLAPLLAGLFAEAIKLLCRRERPTVSGAWYHFRPFSERPLSSGGLSMPSSHAALAFAAAFTLCRLFPAAGPVWLLTAAATAAVRVMEGGHFVSDVCVGAAVGAAAASLAARWTNPSRGPAGWGRRGRTAPSAPSVA